MLAGAGALEAVLSPCADNDDVEMIGEDRGGGKETWGLQLPVHVHGLSSAISK